MEGSSRPLSPPYKNPPTDRTATLSVSKSTCSRDRKSGFMCNSSSVHAGGIPVKSVRTAPTHATTKSGLSQHINKKCMVLIDYFWLLPKIFLLYYSFHFMLCMSRDISCVSRSISNLSLKVCCPG